MDRDCVARIPRAYAVEMALPSPRPQAGGPNAARREQREEGREQKAASSIRCIFTVSRGHVEKVLKIRNGHPNIFTAYLRCPVTTSKSAEKYLSRKVLELTFAKSLKSRGCFEEARQLDSLHIYGVS